MLKKISTLLALALTLILVSPVMAAALSVTSIGNLDTSGTFYASWWYTQENPILSGTADASASVSIDIDGTAGTTTADTLGKWSYATTTLLAGDHTVTVTSGAEVVSFALNIGDTAPVATTIPVQTSTSSATTTLPDSGFGNATIFLALAGIAALGFGGYTFVFAKEK